MLKLIKLEMKKFKIIGQLKGTLICNIALACLFATIIYGSKYSNEISFTDYNMAFSIIDTSVKATFIIYASVLISKLIIDEYRNKTITVLFMYPINRKKLIVSKLIIVIIFTFSSIILSDILMSFILYILNTISNFMPGKLTSTIIINGFRMYLMNALASAGISLIPLYFGMRKKSVSATIVSAIIIVSIICSGGKGISLSSIIIIPIILSIIGLVIAYLSFRNIENVDISN